MLFRAIKKRRFEIKKNKVKRAQKCCARCGRKVFHLFSSSFCKTDNRSGDREKEGQILSKKIIDEEGRVYYNVIERYH